MTIYLKQSTASQEVALGYFLDSTDGNTEETGLTIANTDIKLFKAGATTLANKNSGGATHISNGIYYAVLDATDTNTLGSLVIYCHPTGALATKVDCVVYPANVYDSLIGGTDLLDVSTTQLAGQTVTAGAGVTFPTSVASPTNITAGTITTVTNVTTVNGLAANVITAAATAADFTTEIQTGLATSAELAKVPKSDSNVTWNATALASINTQADLAISDAALATAANLAIVDTVVDSILVDTAEIGIAGAGLTALASQSSVNTIDGIVDDILVDTGTSIPATLSTLSTQSSVNTIDTVVDSIKITTDKLDTALVLDGAVYQYTANALELAPTGGSAPTVSQIADAVWDEAIAGHLTAGSTGNALNAAGSAGDPWSTPIPAAYGVGTAGNLVGNNLNATVSSRATQTSVDTIDGIVDSILDDTAQIGVAGAGLTNINLPNQTMDIIGNITGNLSGSVGSVTGLTVANLDVAVSSRASPTNITAGTITTVGTVNNLATNSVNALALNADAVAEIQSGLATSASQSTLQTSVNDLPTNAELATALASSDDATLAQIALVKAKTDNLPASPAATGAAMTLTSGERTSIATVVWSTVLDGAVTAVQIMRGFGAVLMGKASGLDTSTAVYRDINDTKARITATVDESGNRTVVTKDLD